MRRFLSLAMIVGFSASWIGCGPTPVADTQQTASNSPQSQPSSSAPAGNPYAGSQRPSEETPMAAGTGGGSNSGGYGGDGAGYGGDGAGYPGAGASNQGGPTPGANGETPGFAGTGGQSGNYGGDMQGRPPQGQGGGANGGYPPGFDPNSGGRGEETPSAAGTGGQGGGYPPGFDPNAQGGNQGGGNRGGGGSGGAGASAPGGAAPPPPGGWGRNGGGGGGNSGGASAPGGPAPGPDGSYAGDSSNAGPSGSSNGSFNGSFNGGQQNAQAEPETLKEEAELAFSEGREDDAFQYMYAHYLVERDGIADVDLLMLPGLEAPRVAVRWGVAVEYSAPSTLTGDPPRIGDEPVVEESGRNRGGSSSPQSSGPGAGYGGGSGRGGGNSGDSPAERDLYKYTGEYGEKLVERLEMRRTEGRGFYGQFLADLPESNQGGNNQRNSGNPYAGGGGGSGAARLDDAFGGGGGYPGDRQGGSTQREAPEVVSGQLLPGVMYLGVGNLRESVARARAHGLDALLLFEVDVKVARGNGTKRTEAALKLVNVKTGRAVYSRRALSNFDVWRDREGDNPLLERALDDVFAKNADNLFQLADLPDMSDSDVQARVAELTASEVTNPLPILAELTFYHREDMLSEDEFIGACDSLLDGDGEDFVKGDEEEKLKVIDDWMPGNYTVDDEVGGGGQRFR